MKSLFWKSPYEYVNRSWNIFITNLEENLSSKATARKMSISLGMSVKSCWKTFTLATPCSVGGPKVSWLDYPGGRQHQPRWGSCSRWANHYKDHPRAWIFTMQTPKQLQCLTERGIQMLFQSKRLKTCIQVLTYLSKEQKDYFFSPSVNSGNIC